MEPDDADKQARVYRLVPLRPDFTASAKDTTNVSADGGWLYYVVPS